METNLRELRAVQKMNRAERKAMADSRAMEEQKERENPLSGSGATPSMGLSQVRGGKKMMMNAAAQGKHLMEHLGALHGAGYAKEFHKGMCGAGFFGDLGIPIVSDVASMFGLGKKKHQKKHESDSDSDDERGGLHTGRYEGEGHCGGVKFSRDTQDFSGHMKGGFWGTVMGALPLITRMLGSGKISQGAHDQVKNMIEAHEKKFHSGKMKGGFWGTLASVGLPLLANLLGSGHMTKGAHDRLARLIKKSDKEAETQMVGKGRVVGGAKRSDYGKAFTKEEEAKMVFEPEDEESMARMKRGMFAKGKAKREVGAGDGRRKRAEVVRKVMAEKGMKMIEASKYVKEHGLYKP